MEEVYPPTRAFLWGVASGASLALLGAALALSLGVEDYSSGAKVLMFAPYLSGAVAAGVPSHKLGALDSRVFTVSAAALACSFLLGWVLEYVLFFALITSEDITEHSGRFLWIRYFALSALTVPVGAVIGMNFGRPRRF
ncbi:MAG: hypothetical protein PVG55_03670 [Nitrospirota bacterium]